MTKDLFGNRMKKYEACGDKTLIPNMPIVIRLDGNSFSKLTKNYKFTKPFDEEFRLAMENALVKVLEYTGAKIGYSQSDEITLLLMNIENEEFLSNRVSKICSLCASTASNGFNEYFLKKSKAFLNATFDCRVFTVPEKEVNNVFLWRQYDAWKNAVYSYAFFELQNKKGMTARQATKELKNKSISDKNEFIFKELNFNINDLETKFKRGFCVERKEIDMPVSSLPEKSRKYIDKEIKSIKRNKVIVDTDIPRFDKDKDYIERFLIDK